MESDSDDNQFHENDSELASDSNSNCSSCHANYEPIYNLDSDFPSNIDDDSVRSFGSQSGFSSDAPPNFYRQINDFVSDVSSDTDDFDISTDSTPSFVYSSHDELYNSDNDQTEEDKKAEDDKFRKIATSSYGKDHQFVSTKLEGIPDWTTEDFVPECKLFTASNGVMKHPENPSGVISCCELFIDDEFYQYLIDEINLYHKQMEEKSNDRHEVGWQDVTLKEIKEFVGLMMVTDFMRKRKTKDFWSDKWIFNISSYENKMEKSRFKQILAYLHFNDNEKAPENAPRSYKIKPLLQYFLPKFNDYYKPNKNICLTRDYMSYKKRKSIWTYKPDEIIKSGVLIHAVAECKTGYICQMNIHSKEQALDETIDNLLQPYVSQGYTCYMDKYFNNLDLVTRLLHKNIRSCGPIPEKKLPEEVQKAIKIKGKNKLEYYHCRNGDMLVQAFHRGNVVKMISTLHSSELVIVDHEFHKKKKVLRAKSYMDFVEQMKNSDKCTSFLSSFGLEKTQLKWSKKVFFWLLMCALHNSYVMYVKLNPNSNKMNFRYYLQEYCDHLCTFQK